MSPPRPEQVNQGWLLLAYPDNPPIRLDSRILDRALVDDRHIVLSVDEVTVILQVADAEAALELVEGLAPYTRSAPITDTSQYEAAKQTLDSMNSNEHVEVAPALYFGDDEVRASEDILYIGQFACTISDVARYADVGASLPLPDGHIQAALAMLVVAAKKRIADPASLRRRIVEYELLAK